MKKHAKEGDISYETLEAVKKLKPAVKVFIPEAKAAERWSLTYRYLHKLSSGDKIPSSCKLSTLDILYYSVSSQTVHTDYQRRETSFPRPSQHFIPGPESSKSSRHKPDQQDFISHLSLSPPPDQIARYSNRSPCQQQYPPDMQAERQLAMRAAKKGFEVAAPLLQEKRAAVDAQDADGRTALMRVAEAGDQATARLLLELGAAVDAQDSGGGTPLMRAAAKGHEAVVKLLLARDDVDPEPEDSMGRTRCHGHQRRGTRQ